MSIPPWVQPSDIVIYMAYGGALELYNVANNAITSAGPMGQIGLEWTTAGVGDFSGNPGESDLLMRNSQTGTLGVYDISHNSIAFAAAMGQVGLAWTVAGFGLFNGTSSTDMIMRNSQTGTFELRTSPTTRSLLRNRSGRSALSGKYPESGRSRSRFNGRRG